MNKVILFLSALLLLQENCFATQNFIEDETSTLFSKSSDTFSQICDSLNKLPNDIFAHACPDYIQRHLRVCTQGDTNILLQLYKEAEDKDLPLAQIHLANAYIVQLNKCAEKDFTHIETPEQLKPYINLTQQKYSFLNYTVKKIHPDISYSDNDKIVYEIFKKAMNQGSVYAQVVQIIEHNWSDLGFSNAAQLRPLLNKEAFSELYFLYGKSLFCGSPIGSRFMYEGIKYIHKSGLLTVKFFEEECDKIKVSDSLHFRLSTQMHSFKKYCHHYIQYEDRFNTYFDLNGLMFVGSKVILAPSKKYWKKFLTEHIKEVQLSSLSTFDFLYKADLVLLGDIYINLEIDLEPSSDDNIESVIMHQQNKELGQIAVKLFEESNNIDAILFKDKPKHHPPYKIIKTIDVIKKNNMNEEETNVSEEETNLQNLLLFMSTFMQNCGHGDSVHQFFESYVYYQEKSLIGLKLAPSYHRKHPIK